MEREFNLLDEPWIRVRFPDCTIQEVSLTDALLKSHLVADLSGELPTQDVAVLRLLLAVLHTVFSRVDANGNPSPIGDKDDALTRWEDLWRSGQFPEEPIRHYLEEYKDRFWLFDDERPFYQVPEAKRGTKYKASKLNGELSESSNKTRLFSARSSETKNSLTYAEAARWLLYVNAYDDTSSKPKGKGLPSPGVGWLGKLGLITAVGNNLFETLMLNFKLLNGEDIWDYTQAVDSSPITSQNKPVWEFENPHIEERKEINFSNNPAEFLTLQSRRVMLIRMDKNVVGYNLLGGDFFSKDVMPPEQMTIWSATEEKDAIKWSPRRHKPMHQIWRDFASIALVPDKDTDPRKLPGIVEWVRFLQIQKILEDKEMIRFRISSVQYGDKDFFVKDVFSDFLTFHIDLLTDLGKIWRSHIMDEIKKCDDAAQKIGYLSKNLAKASGDETNVTGSADAKIRLYDRLDAPFRKWLQSIDPNKDNAEIVCLRWRKTAGKITSDLAREFVEDAGEPAFVGRYLEEKDKKNIKTKRHYSSSEAYNLFMYELKKIYETEARQ